MCSPRRGRGRCFGLLLLGLGAWLLLALGVSSCSKRREPSPTTPAASTVPPPPGLLAELVVRAPQASWEAVRAELGLNAAVLPRSLPLFLVSTLDLPAAVADDLDLASPVYGVGDTEADSFGFALAIHTRSGTAAALRLQESHRLQKSQNSQTSQNSLDPQTSQTTAAATATGERPPPAFAIDVVDDYVVVANGARALAALGPYAARSLPLRMSTRHDVSLVLPRQALGGPILSGLRHGWAGWKQAREADDAALRAQHGGDAPDFGDPAQALSDLEGKVSRLFSVLADLDELRVDANLETAAHLARVGMTYRPLSATGPAAEEIAAMDMGDAEPILSLPKSSIVSMFWRESAASRQRSADQQVESLVNVLGERLARADRTKVEAALKTWSAGRGDWLAVGAIWSESVRAVVARSAVADVAAMRKAPEKLLELLSIPSIAAPLSAWMGELKVSPIATAPSPAKAEVRSVHVTRRPRRAGAARVPATDPEPLDSRVAGRREGLSCCGRAGSQASALGDGLRIG